jgi:hypothetical protein
MKSLVLTVEAINLAFTWDVTLSSLRKCLPIFERILLSPPA